MFIFKRILFVRIFRLALQRQQMVDAFHGGIGAVITVLNAEDFLHRPHHKPQVGIHRKHLTDAQAAEQNHHHAQPAKNFETHKKDKK